MGGPTMFRNLIIISLLGVASIVAPVQASAAETTSAVAQQARRYWVQFRQPDWRDQTFNSRYEMDAFIANQRSNGWEVQVFPYELRVRFRLMQWGGSRVFTDLGAAQAWAAYLDHDLGYQPRIVDVP